MKCEKCGTEIRQKAKFCPSCGNPIDWEEEPKKKMSKKMKALIVLVFVLVIGGIVYTKLPKTVDLHDYTTTCKVKGYNGFGTVSIDCKWDKFTIDLAKYLKQKNKDMSESEVQSLVDRTDWNISASKEKGLSNGDVVKAKYDFDKKYLKEYGIVFKGATQKINVKNLKKVKKVDIFDGLELKYSGEGPTIQTDDYITIKKNGQKFECSVTPSSDLQVGDEVTVKYEGDKPVKGIYPKSKTVKLKVPKDLPHIITDPSELTKEDMDKIKEVANKIFKYQAPYTDVFDAWGNKSLFSDEADREDVYDSKLISPTVSDDMFFFAGDDIYAGMSSAVAVKCSGNIKINDEGNGQVQEENVWGMGVSYIEGRNVLDDGGGNMGNYYDHIYTIRKGKWVQIAKGEYGIGDNTELDVEDESNYSYTWNGKKMSKENYEKNLKKIYDKKSATNLDDSYKCVSAEELINELIGSDEETTFDSAKDKSMKQMEE